MASVGRDPGLRAAVVLSREKTVTMAPRESGVKGGASGPGCLAHGRARSLDSPALSAPGPSAHGRVRLAASLSPVRGPGARGPKREGFPPPDGSAGPVSPI